MHRVPGVRLRVSTLHGASAANLLECPERAWRSWFRLRLWPRRKDRLLWSPLSPRFFPAGVLFLFFLVLVLAPLAARAQVVPTVTSFTPTQGTVGSTVMLTVTGTNLTGATGLVLSPPTGITVSSFTVVSSTQLTAQVQIAPNAPTGPRTLSVSFATGAVPAPGTFAVVAMLPTLTSATPGVTAQGARNLRLTLMGTNFRPGAQVVISPPLPDPSLSGADQQATDISITSQTMVSSTLILAVIDVAGDAAIGARAVDVVNADGTHTGAAARVVPGSGTSQRLLLTGRGSLGAPLDVQTLAITHPRNGTIIAQADQLYAEAILAGVGTGTITGAWLWDGNAVEQFTVNLTGGDRTTIRTSRPLPTQYLGLHRLELRITAPNQQQSAPVSVVVNPGQWKLERLIGPTPGLGFLSTQPPVLRWVPVPGAARYQVGFASEPFFGRVRHWHDVGSTEWAVPDRLWNDLPEGEIYWTVRVVEISGEARRPLPMRRIVRVPSGALQAAQAAPARTTSGSALLEWRGLSGSSVYRVTISRDAEGRDVVKRFLTRDPKLDLRAIQTLLKPGETYYWEADAFTPRGRAILAGPRQSFVAGDLTGQLPAPRGFTSEIASLRVVPPAELAEQIARRKPGPGDHVGENRPPVTVEFKSDVAPTDVVLELDDTDVTAMATIEPRKVSLNPVIPLDAGEHTLRVAVGSESESWKFHVSPPKVSTAGAGLGTQPGTDAEDESAQPEPSGQLSAADKGAESVGAMIGPQVATEVSANTQWISGAEADTFVLGLAHRTTYQNGPWRAETNGTGLLNALLGPEPRTARGGVNDYVFHVGYDQPRWGMGIRFGMLSPSLFSYSEFVTPGSPREGVEPVLRTPLGTFGYYNNTNDAALGGGSGVAFHQELRGASYAAPLPQERATFRLMWLSAQDRSTPKKVCFDPFSNPIPCTDPVAQAGAGDLYGGLLQLKLGPYWTWNSEYAWGYNNPNVSSPTARRVFGRAWRTAIAGSWQNTTISVAYRDVGPNFASPANPSLSQFSNPGRRGVDAAVSRPTVLGTFSIAYKYLQSDIHRADRPRLTLHDLGWQWSKNLTSTTVIGAGGRQARTFTGELPPAVLLLSPAEQLAVRTDTRDLGGQVFITHTVGQVTLGASGSRNWLRNRLIDKANVITAGVQLNANWNARAYFQLNSNFSVNWVAGEPSTVGETRVVTTYIQPMLIWQRAGLTLTPLVAVTQLRTQLATGLMTNDNSTWQYLGRLSWQMPGPAKFSTLSLEAGNTRMKNALTGMDIDNPRFLLLWTVVWGYDHR